MIGLFITINYNSSKNTIEFLQSLITTNMIINNEVIVYDNNSNISEKNLLKEYLEKISLKNIKLIESDVNYGYFGSASRVIDIIDIKKYDFTVICNNDIIIKDNFQDKLKKTINKYDIIAPKIISMPTGKDQNPFREKPINGFVRIAYELYFLNAITGYVFFNLWTLFKKLKKPERLNYSHYEHEIYSPHGSFIIFSKTFFEKGGFIDKKLFLYAEENFITAICNRFNLKIGYVPDIVVYHNEHSTTAAFNFSAKIYKFERKGYKYIKKKYPEFFNLRKLN